MTLSLNEIRKRAIEFSKEWEPTSDERAESQSFWNTFFNVLVYPESDLESSSL